MSYTEYTEKNELMWVANAMNKIRFSLVCPLARQMVIKHMTYGDNVEVELHTSHYLDLQGEGSSELFKLVFWH
jgi:hypothetical protein